MGFDLNLQVFLVAGVRKRRERESFQGRRRGLEVGLSGGLCYSRAGPGGWRGNLEETPGWEPGCEKETDQKSKGEGRGRASSPKRRGDVEVQRAHGLSSNPDSGLDLGLSLAWPSGGSLAERDGADFTSFKVFSPLPTFVSYKMCSQREAMGLGPWG